MGMIREELLDWLCRLRSDISYMNFSIDVTVSLERKKQYKQALSEVINALEQEPRKGHWIDTHEYHYYNDGDIETTELRCSCCNEVVEWDIELLHKPYFCENCGADMRGEEE